MTKLFSGIYFQRALLFIVLIELFSFLGYLFPVFNMIAFGVIVILVFFISLKRIDLGWFVVMVELVIGSKGHLFSIMDLGFPISIRLGLFLSVLGAFLIRAYKGERIAFLQSRFFYPYLIFLLTLLIGLFAGLISGNSLKIIFLDLNGYLYFALALVAFQVLRTQADLQHLLQILCAAIIASIVKSFLLLYFFSHQIPYVLPFIYRWVRVTGVGEITAMQSGFYRIFFQSHIYEVFAFFLLFAILLHRRTVLKTVLLASLISGIILLSYSRSLWLGFGGGWIALLVLFAKEKGFSFYATLKSFGLIIGILGCGALIVLGIVKFPFPNPSRIDISNLITERTEDIEEEAAGASRLALLGPLLNQALKNPITGTGFGSVVTYTSSDPRVLQTNPSGEYSTYAFEWGYLGFIVKFGLIGSFAYAWLLWTILRQGWSALKNTFEFQDQILVIGLIAALVALIVIHATTPYLDHPLGIGFVLISAVIFERMSSNSFIKKHA